MIVRVNGEERGRGNSGDNQHNFERCITQVSRSETLYPGEILGLGTVGNGSGFETLTWLDSGDVVELEIEGISQFWNDSENSSAEMLRRLQATEAGVKPTRYS